MLPISSGLYYFSFTIFFRNISVCALQLVMLAKTATAQDSSYNKSFTPTPVSLLVPAIVSSYGFIALKNPALQQLNQQIQEGVTPFDKRRKCKLDDYLQFGPAGMALTMNMAGIRGRSQTFDAAAIYAGSEVVLVSTVLSLKKMTAQLRPDSSGNNSFPSGHTATAFASAEFLRMEYKEISPWMGVAGYAMAFTTGYLRIYNNKHRLSEVITGACIGIISTKLSYWGWSKIKKKIYRKSH